MQQLFTLDQLPCGQSARIAEVGGAGPMRSRLCDLGFTENTCITPLFHSALGDPTAYRVKDTVVALRRADARSVRCVRCGGSR